MLTLFFSGKFEIFTRDSRLIALTIDRFRPAPQPTLWLDRRLKQAGSGDRRDGLGDIGSLCDADTAIGQTTITQLQ
jgi:hypothetical protein